MGNAYSALLCAQWAKQHQASLLLRLEDIDFTRCREHYSQYICEDLSWLGIHFDGKVSYQQQRHQHYQQALNTLIHMGVLYPCICTRKQINNAPSLQQRMLLDNYPYTCRQSFTNPALSKHSYAWRLHQEKVTNMIGEDLSWSNFEGKKTFFKPSAIGDVIIGRKDIGFSYHLCVVVDDALQGISHVIRGIDLQDSTPVHRILQTLLGYPSPLYQHHPLILDAQGQRLAKSKQSTTLQALRQSGTTASDVRKTLLA